ncbi:hypothetical protein FKM82_031301 [Ascaphus truei]
MGSVSLNTAHSFSIISDYPVSTHPRYYIYSRWLERAISSSVAFITEPLTHNSSLRIQQRWNGIVIKEQSDCYRSKGVNMSSL